MTSTFITNCHLILTKKLLYLLGNEKNQVNIWVYFFCILWTNLISYKYTYFSPKNVVIFRLTLLISYYIQHSNLITVTFPLFSLWLCFNLFFSLPQKRKFNNISFSIMFHLKLHSFVMDTLTYKLLLSEKK